MGTLPIAIPIQRSYFCTIFEVIATILVQFKGIQIEVILKVKYSLVLRKEPLFFEKEKGPPPRIPTLSK